jgi:diaminohydroxyphosphoribosylaminopyrimidine deaminase/5-amino-6-(5-phosphoribosylamino)uracil reductase
MRSPDDTRLMARALELARRGRYATRPNPAVGCVLARDGAVIGEGFTRPAGGNHAEIEALRSCADARGATAYVTLEPCAHTGRTGPCVAALIEAGIASVEVAVRDPNPLVAGQGVDRLRQAGIAVGEGLLAGEAEAVNRGFFKRMVTGLPYVRLKLAASLDGRTAMASGESQWITGPAARADVQELRARSCAIVTGIGTVLADDPALTVRDDRFDIPAQPLRVVLDTERQIPVTARLLGEPGHTLLVHAGGAREAQPGLPVSVEQLSLPIVDGGLDLEGLLRELGRRQCNDVLVECGARLAGAFLQQGLLDELRVYMAPVLLGSEARPLLELPLASMAEKRGLHISELRWVGEDIRITCLPAS